MQAPLNTHQELAIAVSFSGCKWGGWVGAQERQWGRGRGRRGRSMDRILRRRWMIDRGGGPRAEERKKLPPFCPPLIFIPICLALFHMLLLVDIFYCRFSPAMAKSSKKWFDFALQRTYLFRAYRDLMWSALLGFIQKNRKDLPRFTAYHACCCCCWNLKHMCQNVHLIMLVWFSIETSVLKIFGLCTRNWQADWICSLVYTFNIQFNNPLKLW